MHKALLMMLLAVVSSTAAGEWVLTDKNETSTLYVDPATIYHSNNLVKIWHLHDYKVPQQFKGNPYLSQREQHEYDCKEKRTRILYVSWHTQNMANGGSVYAAPSSNDWLKVPADSFEATLRKLACEKR